MGKHTYRSYNPTESISIYIPKLVFNTLLRFLFGKFQMLTGDDCDSWLVTITSQANPSYMNRFIAS